MVDLIINRIHMVMVKMPKRTSEGITFDEWGVVGMINASDDKEAITKAIQRTPSLFEFVPEGEMQFMAIPASGPDKVRRRRCTVFQKEQIII